MCLTPSWGTLHPDRSLRALLHPGERALPIFRLVYGAGICTGMLRARRGRNAK